ncbi:dihydrofolate reductase family protein [Cohnella kolymensis]|uniref:dihydrofolate reductase family protein n=1 Tax=Cohnella kolymensis TaxID=1590652 RepID=UPI000695C897|nr:dihydrofolate reductase family protein [Cohnella kolymensis]
MRGVQSDQAAPVEGAIEQAKQAAGEKDVMVVGGPIVGQQLLKAGLVEELQIGISGEAGTYKDMFV